MAVTVATIWAVMAAIRRFGVAQLLDEVAVRVLAGGLQRPGRPHSGQQL